MVSGAPKGVVSVHFGMPGVFAAEDDVLAALVVFGVALCVLGVLAPTVALIGGRIGARGRSAGALALALANGLLTGLGVGVALGLVGGLAFMLAATHLGPLGQGFPFDRNAGLIDGVGLGILLGFAAGRVWRLPLGLSLGATLGLAVGLVGFRLALGPTAGFGGEIGFGAGPEIGLDLALAGGLLGALIGTVAEWRAPASTAVVGPRRPVVVGAETGFAGGVLAALVGWVAGWFVFIVPPIAFEAACNPVCSSGLPPVVRSLGLVYGLGVFGLGGALVGALLGSLARRRSGATNDGAGATIHWAGLAPGLAAGLAGGLAAGFAVGFVGGPPPPPFLRLPQPNPAAGWMGLWVGLAGGALVGVGLAAALAWAERRPERRSLVLGAVAVAMGILVLTLPHWYLTVFFLNVP